MKPIRSQNRPTADLHIEYRYILASYNFDRSKSKMCPFEKNDHIKIFLILLRILVQKVSTYVFAFEEENEFLWKLCKDVTAHANNMNLYFQDIYAINI